VRSPVPMLCPALFVPRPCPDKYFARDLVGTNRFDVGQGGRRGAAHSAWLQDTGMPNSLDNTAARGAFVCISRFLLRRSAFLQRHRRRPLLETVNDVLVVLFKPRVLLVLVEIGVVFDSIHQPPIVMKAYLSGQSNAKTPHLHLSAASSFVIPLSALMLSQYSVAS